MIPRARGALFVMALVTGLMPGAVLQAQTSVALEFDSLHFRSIGPALTSGRVSDIAVHPDNHASQSGTGAHSLRIRVSTPWPQARQPPRTIGPRVTRMSWHTWQRWK